MVQKTLTLRISARVACEQRVQEVLDRIAQSAGDDYTVTLKSSGADGYYTVSIAYNPEKITCHVSECKTIAQKESLVVSCYKNNVLKVLKDSSDSILKHVHYQPPMYKVIM